MCSTNFSHFSLTSQNTAARDVRNMHEDISNERKRTCPDTRYIQMHTLVSYRLGQQQKKNNNKSKSGKIFSRLTHKSNNKNETRNAKVNFCANEMDLRNAIKKQTSCDGTHQVSWRNNEG